jgi:hypothetical protein
VKNLSYLFCSRTHYLLLETLALRTQPCHLRGLQELTDQYIHSIENAVKDLRQKKIVVCKRKSRSVFIKLNEKSPYVPLLRKIFYVVEQERIKRNSKELDEKAKNLIQFIDSSLELLRKVKPK